MKYLSTLLFIVFSFSAFAQTDTIKRKLPTRYRTDLPKKPKQEKPYGTMVSPKETMPRYPGCEDMESNEADKKSCADQKMLEFIYENICYPDSARENGIEGTVVISFVVEKDGTISNPKIIRAIGGGCEEELMRVVRMFPRFIPGEYMDKKVRVQINLPIRFRLE